MDKELVPGIISVLLLAAAFFCALILDIRKIHQFNVTLRQMEEGLHEEDEGRSNLLTMPSSARMGAGSESR